MSLEREEIEALQQEFEWLLHEEVNVILNQLHNLIVECCRRFPVRVPGLETLVKPEKYQLQFQQAAGSGSNTSGSGATGQGSGGTGSGQPHGSNSSHQDQVKITATLQGDNISHADITLRLQKHSVPNLRTIVQNDAQWKLHQIQDAANHLMAALMLLSSPPLRYNEEDHKYDFKSADELIQLINSIMNCLQKGRNSLIVPKKRTIEELQNSRNMKSLQPPLPNDLAISFYIQAHKLICAVYQVHKDAHGNLGKFDIYQADTSIPWLSEALVLFTVGLQFCQQLKDKVSVFTLYRDMQVV